MIGPGDIHTAARLFHPEQLTLARELRGLTRLEVAAKIGKTPSAVSQFESGRARPDGQTIARLMLALGMPASFFGRTPQAVPFRLIPVEQGHFRSLRSVSQRARRKLLARGSLHCGLLSFLEQQVDLPPERVSALATTADTPPDIEVLAIETRKRWGLGLGPIGSMVNLLERHGVVVLPIDEECREVDAFSLWNDRRPCVFLVVEKGSTSRTRMDAAHELGHLILHADVTAGSPELEQQANHFGSAFLMPRDSFLHEAPRRLNWEHIWELKRRWKVSAAAILRRSHELGTLTEATYRRGFVQLNVAGERRNEPHEPPAEAPVALRKALELLAPEWPLSRLAEHLGLHASDLHELVAFTNPGPLTATPPVPVLEGDGPLFSEAPDEKNWSSTERHDTK